MHIPSSPKQAGKGNGRRSYSLEQERNITYNELGSVDDRHGLTTRRSTWVGLPALQPGSSVGPDPWGSDL